MKSLMVAAVMVMALISGACASGEMVQIVKTSPDGKTFVRLYEQPCTNGKIEFLFAASGADEMVKGDLKRADGRFFLSDGRQMVGFTMVDACYAQSTDDEDKYLIIFSDGDGGLIHKKAFQSVDNDTIKIDPDEVPSKPGLSV